MTVRSFPSRVVHTVVGRIRFARGKCPGCNRKIDGSYAGCKFCNGRASHDTGIWNDFRRDVWK